MRKCFFRLKDVALLTAFIFIFEIIFSGYNLAHAETYNNALIIEKTVDKTEVYSGEEFTYTIKYANPNTTENAHNVIVTDLLPKEVEFVSSVGSKDVERIDKEVVDGRSLVSFIFKEWLPAGSTGILKITVKFPVGVTEDKVEALNVSNIQTSNTPEVTSNEVVVKSKVKEPDWSITKKRIIPGDGASPAVGQPVTYEIAINGNSPIGGLNLKDAKIVDTLPTGAEFVSASNDGNYDSEYNTVTWEIGNLPVASLVKEYVTVIYPEELFSVDGSDKIKSVINKAEGFVKLLGSEVELTKTSEAGHGFSLPVPSAAQFTKTSRQGNDEYSIGQTARFFISNIGNTGNVPIDNFIIEDVIPKEINLTSVSLGNFNMEHNVTVRYKTNTGEDWKVWHTGIANGGVLSVEGLGLQTGEYITNVQWDFESVPAGFKNTSPIEIDGTVESQDKEGNEIKIGDKIINTASLSWIFGEEAHKQDASVDITVSNKRPWLQPIKYVDGTNVLYPGKTVEYRLRIKNHDYATGDYINPVAVEVLPEKLENPEYLRIEKGNTNYSGEPQFTISEDKALLKWSFNDLTLKPGEYVDLIISARVKDNARVGKVTNTFYITTNETDDFKVTDSFIDINDYDGDTSNSDILAKGSTDIFIKFIGSLESRKWLKGELDSDWSLYNGYGKTLPGGIADYRLIVSNNGSNGPISNIVIMDVLPHSGDAGVIDPKARESKWRPNLVNKISLIDEATGEKIDPKSKGIKIYYSTDDNPSRAQLKNPLNRDNTGWSEEPPKDITSVKSLKFDFGSYELQPDEKIILEWPMRAPDGAPRGEVAWNSFGFGATYPDVNGPEAFPASEPLKVGFEVQDDPEGKVNLGDFVWEDLNKNGIQENGEPGINGILVKLYRGDNPEPIKYTRSGDNQDGKPGYFLFPNLDPLNNYHIEFEIPDEYKVSPANKGIDRGLNSDITLVNGKWTTGNIDLTSKKDDLSWDAGLYRLAAIGDYVWNDLNADGRQDGNEPGIKDAVVNLYDADTKVKIADTLTDDTGKYLFSGLEPGGYYLNFILRDADFVFTKKDAASDDLDSDADTTNGNTITKTLISAEVDPKWDAGMHRGAIGDFVWHDLNANGIQEKGEAGIAGVTVRLYKGDNTLYAETTTILGGYYEFTDLPSGEYYVEFVKPKGFDKFSPTGKGNKDTDSDPNVETGITEKFILYKGQRDMSHDAGLYKLASLGDFVWDDLNADGLQKSSNPYKEPGIQGVTVNLYKKGESVVFKQATTDANGIYKFQGLNPGVYYLEFVKPDGYVFSPRDAGDDKIDSDADTTTGKTIDLTLKSGDNITTWDAGLHMGYIGDYVWEDINGDGIQNDGNTGINGVVVNLYDSSKNKIKTTTTANSLTNTIGYYEFTHLSPGKYYVEFVKPNGYTFTLKNSTLDSKKDSNPNRDTGMTDEIDIILGGIDTTIDAGMYRYASLGDYVWDDTNGDGIQNPDEVGINGVMVSLCDENGNELGISSVTSDDSQGKPGYYKFTELAPGKYKVKFKLKEGYDSFTTKNAVIDNKIDSDSDKEGLTDVVTLKSGDNITTVDSGVYKYVSLGDRVWDDKNANGIQEDKEANVEGVKVDLYSKNGTLVNSTVTNKEGIYLFNNLQPGEYYLEFNVLGGYHVSPQHNGNAEIDSDINTVSNITDTMYLPSGKNDMTIDAGIYRLASIGDYVWNDKNNNGIQDTGEEGIEGARVDIYDSMDNIKGSTTTDASGHYSFENLEPGNYYLVFEKLLGYEFSLRKQGNDIQIDSDADTTTGRTDTFELYSGDNDLTFDAGLHKYAAIGDFVWEDTNGNGIQDVGEKGISNVVVILYDSKNNEVKRTTTDIDGIYEFKNISPGSYSVQFILPDGYRFTAINQDKDGEKDSNAEASTGKTSIVNLMPDDNNLSIDAGMYRPCSIGDLVWLDLNDNGIQDEGEKGFNKIKVNLYNDNGKTPIMTTETDENGKYEFKELKPGKYTVEFVTPGGYAASPQGEGDDASKDSNGNRTTGRTDEIILVSGENNTTIDMGMYLIPDNTAAIGDFVWHDKNGNGIQDSGEPGIKKVEVILYNRSGVKVASTTTDDKGFYEFKGLTSGDYSIEFITPDGYVLTKQKAGDAKIDSNPDESGKTEIKNLKNGEVDTTFDAGMFKKASIGDLVWRDKNHNGIQDYGEKPQRGVNVELYNGHKELIGKTRTDESGRYIFTNLNPGVYYVKFLIPSGYAISPKNQGIDRFNDSDAGTLGWTEAIYLESGVYDDSFDAGIYKIKSAAGGGSEDEEIFDDNGDLIGGSPITPPNDGGGNSGNHNGNNGGNSSSGNHPKTATGYYNYLVLGLAMLGASLILSIYNRRREN